MEKLINTKKDTVETYKSLRYFFVQKTVTIKKFSSLVVILVDNFRFMRIDCITQESFDYCKKNSFKENLKIRFKNLSYLIGISYISYTNKTIKVFKH